MSCATSRNDTPLHLVSFVQTDAGAGRWQTLRQWCETVDIVRLQRSRIRDGIALIESFLSHRPFLVQRDDSDTMRLRIKHPSVPLRSMRSMRTNSRWGGFRRPPVRLRVLDEHNAVWTIVRRAARHEGWGLRRIVADLEWRRLRTYEGALCRQFDRVLVVSDADLVDLK